MITVELTILAVRFHVLKTSERPCFLGSADLHNVQRTYHYVCIRRGTSKTVGFRSW